MQPGGRTELESEESRDRIEDAVCAVKAALNQGGFVAGGGSALLKASLALDRYVEEMAVGKSTEWRYGVLTTQKACYAPFDKIAQNAIGSSDATALRSRVLD